MAAGGGNNASTCPGLGNPHDPAGVNACGGCYFYTPPLSTTSFSTSNGSVLREGHHFVVTKPVQASSRPPTLTEPSQAEPVGQRINRLAIEARAYISRKAQARQALQQAQTTSINTPPGRKWKGKADITAIPSEITLNTLPDEVLRFRARLVVFYWTKESQPAYRITKLQWLAYSDLYLKLDGLDYRSLVRHVR